LTKLDTIFSEYPVTNIFPKHIQILVPYKFLIYSYLFYYHHYLAVFSELGVIPISIDAIKLSVGFWNHLVNSDDVSLIEQAYKFNFKHKLPYTSNKNFSKTYSDFSSL
jgi:hypothetical protein